MGKQSEIPGTERKRVKEIDDAAEGYVKARDARMKLTEKEVEMRDALVEAMRKHSLSVYRDSEASPPLLVLLKEGKATVKVTTEAPEEADGAAE